jgi:hypothetical protein
VKAGAKLPLADISQNWEIDTLLGGEQTEEHDEFAEGEAAISFTPRTTDKIAVIAIHEKLGGRFRFERLLNSMLKKVMKRFAVAAKFGGTEAYIWIQEAANDNVIKLRDNGLRSSNNQAWPWMRDRIYDADAEDLKEEMEFGFDGMDTSAWATRRRHKALTAVVMMDLIREVSVFRALELGMTDHIANIAREEAIVSILRSRTNDSLPSVSIVTSTVIWG